MTDPDLGTLTHGFDQNGNATQSVDARGGSGTVYAGYDGLDRPIWRNSTNSPTGAYETFAYDSVASGNNGVGRLTSETFTGGPNQSLTGSYSYVYDKRGQETSATLTVGATNYPVQNAFDDAGNTLTQTYPTGEVVTTGYTGQGWLSSVGTSQGNTSLLSSASYAGFGGAAQQLTSASLGSGRYQYSASFDALLRPTDLKVANGSTTLFEQTRGFDAAGNVTSANTTLPAGTDNQAFCYDAQDRLTWAGSTGTPPCGVGLTPGSLTAANYTQAFGYDNLGRLTSGPLGAYSYGNGAHLHAATVIGSAYTAAYDPAGDMTCRAPSSASTCASTQTGAQLSYDTEGQLAAWQNAPSAPTTTAGFLYDNQGNRVEQQLTQGGTTTTMVYVGNLEEVASSGGTSTTTTYYYAGGQRMALAVNGVFSYLASDGLGSAQVVLNSGGSATASLLYAPYGGSRYSNGTMPTSYGFTGQRAEAATGLDYYNARYYDPLAAQFASADTLLPGGGYDILGLSRYAYVEGNPEVRTDPTGQHLENGCEPSCDNTAYDHGHAYQLCYDAGNVSCGQAIYWKYRADFATPLASARLASRLLYASSNKYISHISDEGKRALVLASGMGDLDSRANNELAVLHNELASSLVQYGLLAASLRASLRKKWTISGSRSSAPKLWTPPLVKREVRSSDSGLTAPPGTTVKRLETANEGLRRRSKP